MDRAILVCVFSCGLILAAAATGRSEEPAQEKQGNNIVMFVTIFEESGEKRTREILAEPTLTTRLGRPTGFSTGGQVPIGSQFFDVGQRFEFVPIKVNGQTIWFDIKSEYTEFIPDKQGSGRLSVKKQVAKAKFQLGKLNVSDSWKWSPKPGKTCFIEFRVEQMTDAEYERMEAEAREDAKRN